MARIASIGPILVAHARSGCSGQSRTRTRAPQASAVPSLRGLNAARTRSAAFEYDSDRGVAPAPPSSWEATLKNTLGLLTLSAGLAIAGCSDDAVLGGAPQGGNPSGGSAQGAGPQGAGSQGGDGPVAGQPQGGASQGGSSQGGASQGGASQGGSSQGGSSQGGDGQGGAGQGGNGGDGNGGGGTGGGGTGGGGGGPPALTCQTGCEALFDCALEDDGSGNQNCPGLQASDGPFLIPGCVTQCNSMMAVLALIDPSDCEGTINTISAVSSQFDDACQNGL